mmetsp:Transcript_11469/g.48111  ORF Transcript_11469/g.48111 Transcript_11469/m.48111 type:complete len:570 (-) Transcript_11469:629-2338(-)
MQQPHRGARKHSLATDVANDLARVYRLVLCQMTLHGVARVPLARLYGRRQRLFHSALHQFSLFDHRARGLHNKAADAACARREALLDIGCSPGGLGVRIGAGNATLARRATSTSPTRATRARGARCAHWWRYLVYVIVGVWLGCVHPRSDCVGCRSLARFEGRHERRPPPGVCAHAHDHLPRDSVPPRDVLAAATGKADDIAECRPVRLLPALADCLGAVDLAREWVHVQPAPFTFREDFDPVRFRVALRLGRFSRHVRLFPQLLGRQRCLRGRTDGFRNCCSCRLHGHCKGSLFFRVRTGRTTSLASLLALWLMLRLPGGIITHTLSRPRRNLRLRRRLLLLLLVIVQAHGDGHAQFLVLIISVGRLRSRSCRLPLRRRRACHDDVVIIAITAYCDHVRLVPWLRLRLALALVSMRRAQSECLRSGLLSPRCCAHVGHEGYFMHHGFRFAAANRAAARWCVLEPFLAHTRDGGLRSYRINSNDQPCREVRSTQGSAANDGCLVLGDAHSSSRINAALDGRIAIAIDAPEGLGKPIGERTERLQRRAPIAHMIDDTVGIVADYHGSQVI